MEILSFISGLGTVVSTVSACFDLFTKVKKELSESKAKPADFEPQTETASRWMLNQMQPLQPRMQDPYQGGNQWLPGLQQMAGQQGNPWVPVQTSGMQGIDLTGVWSPPGNMYDQTYIRQYGPYLNIIAGVAQIPTLMAEGILNPVNGIIFITGRNAMGAQVTAQLQLRPDWSIGGILQVPNAFGMMVPVQIYMVKIA